MSLFSKIFQFFRPHRDTGQFVTLSGPSSLSGHVWSGDLYATALVRESIDARARHAGKLKVEFLGSGEQKLIRQLKTAPNPWQSWYKFIYRLSTILDMQGTAFIVPILGDMGQTTGITTICPSRWELVTDQTGEPWLRFYFDHGDNAAIELERVGIMTKFQYASDYFGTTNEALEDTMKLVEIQSKGIEAAIKTSASYRFAATLSNFAMDDDLVKERNRFNEKNFSGDGGGLILFPNTYKDIKQIVSKPFTVDYSTMNMIAAQVYSYFGVNENVLQNKATPEEADAFYEGAIEPFAVQLSEVLTAMLFTSTEQAHGNSVIVSENRLLYMSASDKVNMARDMVDRGIFTVNDVLTMFGMATIGEEGDKRVIRGEYKSTTDINANDKDEGNDDEQN